jgi:hypothetical protein
MKIITILMQIMLVAGTLGTANSEALTSHSDESIAGGAYLTIAEKFGGEITLQELKSTEELGVAGCAAGSKIVQFRLEIYAAQGKKTFKRSTHRIDREISGSLGKLKVGDSFNFFSVKATLPSGDKVDVVSRKFIVIG